MIALLHKKSFRSFLLKPTAIVALGYGLLAFLVLFKYLKADLVGLSGLLLLPFITIIDNGNRSHRYIFILIPLLAASYFSKALTIYYLTLIISALYAIESLYGKMNSLPLFITGISSPIFYYITEVLGFPLRLTLSKAAGSVMNSLGEHAIVNGNLIQINGHDFSVDPACAGLKMISSTLIILFLLIAYYGKKYEVKLSLYKTILIIITGLILNIFSNFLRILLLILFKIGPENIFHEPAGLLCMLIYVIAPSIWLIRYMHKKESGKFLLITSSKSKPVSTLLIIAHVFIYLLLIIKGIEVQKTGANGNIATFNCEVNGFQKEILDNGVCKFSTGTTLIYVKGIQSFYSTEHNPMICWKGSGYEFTEIKKETIDDIELFTGKLKNNKSIIYTAWWFDNGSIKTSDQLVWRWEAFKTGLPVAMINISAENNELLQKEVKKLLQTNVFKN